MAASFLIYVPSILEFSTDINHSDHRWGAILKLIICGRVGYDHTFQAIRSDTNSNTVTGGVAGPNIHSCHNPESSCTPQLRFDRQPISSIRLPPDSKSGTKVKHISKLGEWPPTSTCSRARPGSHVHTALLAGLRATTDVNKRRRRRPLCGESRRPCLHNVHCSALISRTVWISIRCKYLKTWPVRSVFSSLSSAWWWEFVWKYLGSFQGGDAYKAYKRRVYEKSIRKNRF